MKIIKIIHGYPPLYNAGSEVYSQLLCLGLSQHHEVHVFTREENPFAPDFSLRTTTDSLDIRIKLHFVNIPLEKYRYQFSHSEIDLIFAKLMENIKPDIVHIGHLNHLSTSLVFQITKRDIPIVYTLHDYWLMCPRGQFIKRNAKPPQPLWALCNGQDDFKCAENCYAGYATGIANQIKLDRLHWQNWVERRMAHMREMAAKIDCFIAPSRYLYDRYKDDFKLPEEKLIYLDYGFDLKRLKFRSRAKPEIFSFGYIGTHIPAKGIQNLLRAFSMLTGNCQLKIWGRDRSQSTAGLKAIVKSLPENVQNRISWQPEYRNQDIVEQVFNHTDCIVVPSIWVENSPLVIHEALQVRVPVITANMGGMAEYVQHNKNGLLFKHRNIDSLAEQMQLLLDNPKLATELAQGGYLQSEDGNVPSLEQHVFSINKIYTALLNQKGKADGNEAGSISNYF